jgi:Leucine-rich repeat (LRR) protein
MTEIELKNILSSTDSSQIEQILHEPDYAEMISPFTGLFESIWKMTYACTTDPEFSEIQKGNLAEKIVLMNEQEDLIPKELTSIEQVSKLDLGGFPEADLFPELFRYKNLHRLDLWENELSILPVAFFEFDLLEELHISCNLTELSPSIGNLRQLKLLSLPGNRLRQIPESIHFLVNLKELDLSNNQLLELPSGLSELPLLKKLNIYGNPHLVLTGSDLGNFQKKEISLIR